MIDPKPHPSRLLHWFAVAARWALAGLLALWLLLGATAGVLHGFIVPRIGDYRGQLEQLAAQTLGVPVRIGAVKAHSEGLMPTLELLDVELQDARSQPALRLPRVVVTVSARSIWRKGVEQLVVEAPQLDVRRLADGRWEVAGLLQQSDAASDPTPLEWVLDQPEIAIRGGTVRWVDELRGTPVQQLSAVDIALRNGRWRHDLQVTAQLNAEQGGSPLTLLGHFREPVLSTGHRPWEHWQGQWFAQGDLQRMPTLPWPQEWGVAEVQAQGTFRAWADVRKGALDGVAVDLRLPQATVVWSGAQAPLALRDVSGRLSVQTLDGGWQAQASDWAFTLDDGTHWPASQWTVRWPQAGSAMPHALEASYVDLAMLRGVATRLPLTTEQQAQVQRWNVRGQARNLNLGWQPAQKTQGMRYHAQGQVQGLLWQDQGAPLARVPGVQDLDARFKLDQQGGSADVEVHDGALDFPGIFEEPRIPIDRLQATVRWSQDAGGRWSVQVPQAEFANADAQGKLTARWQMGADAAQRLPGELVLEGQLSRANGARVHRYLPLEIPAQARHYVRDAVRSGNAAGVRFQVRGALTDFPFDRGHKGIFHIAAPVRDVVFDYVPPNLRAPGEPAWPLISKLAGDLVFDQAGMQVRNAHGWFGEGGKVPMEGIQAAIPDLSHPVLGVTGHGKAALPAWLEVVAHSPLAALTEHALDQAKAEGPATLDLDLHLPIDHLHQSRVKGTVGLQGNRLRFRADVPELQDARGAVQFSEQGFELKDIQAQSLGGALQVSGGLRVGKGAPVLDIRARGRATAEGLHRDGFLAPVAAIAAHASGATDYEVQVGLQRALPQVLVRSSLQGLAVHLPAPLGKAADSSVPLLVQQRLTPAAAADARAPLQETLQVHVQDRAALTYLLETRDGVSTVSAGRILLGGDVGAAGALPADMQPGSGVQARVQLDALDADAWLALPLPSAEPAAGADTAGHSDAAAAAYLPRSMALRVGALQLHGRTLYEVVAGMTQADAVWRGTIQSRQLGGYMEYHEPGTTHPQGLVFARLSHLLLPEGAADQADKLLQSQPKQMPALDINVKEFALAGKALGSLTVQARNVRRESGAQWVLDRFDVALPEANLRASGTWGGPDAQRRRTHLRFGLELKDSGALLERFGMPGVIRRGKGALQGELEWRGAPIAPDWAGLAGHLHLDVGSGQFLKAEPGLAKLLSVLSLQSLPRRIGLDFRDIFSSGFAFDFVRGDVDIAQGVARTNNLQMKGVNAAVLMEGQANVAEETQQLRVVVVPEINAMTASLVATAINPVIGLGSFLAQALLRGPMVAMATREFEVTGSWDDPQVRSVPHRTPPVSPSEAATAPGSESAPTAADMPHEQESPL